MKSITQICNEALQINEAEKEYNDHTSDNEWKSRVWKSDTGFVFFMLQSKHKGSFNNSVNNNDEVSNGNTVVFGKYWYSGSSSSAVKISKGNADKVVEVLIKEGALNAEDKKLIKEVSKLFDKAQAIFEKLRMSK